MLKNPIDPQITEIIENDPTYRIHSHHFQQDGATPHYVPAVRDDCRCRHLLTIISSKIDISKIITLWQIFTFPIQLP